MDPATGSALIAGLKALRDMVKDNKDPDMMGKLLEIQSQVFDLMSANKTLEQENSSLKERLAQKEVVELRDDGAVWRKTDKASRSFGGFCPNCHAANGKLIKLDVSNSAEPYRYCTICKFNISSPWM